jgi:predicted metal-dependent phosphoesterase TrpH
LSQLRIGGLITSPSRVDLHSHTSASDGSLSSAALVSRAASLGVEVLAITDHDTTDGVPAAMAEAQRQGITLVPGVEVSTISRQEEIHLLGLFVDLDNKELQAVLAATREARWTRAQRMLARLSKLGLPVDWGRVIAFANGSHSIGRPHVAATLLEAGHVSSYNEAFEMWIGRGRPAYVERYKLSPEGAIQLIRRSGGLAVLAHPYIYNWKGECKVGLNLRRWLPRLRDAGLEGMEVYYPHYGRAVSRHLLTVAVKYGLLIAGGSDYHGDTMGNGLGSVAVPWAAWEGLKRRNTLRRAAPYL